MLLVLPKRRPLQVIVREVDRAYGHRRCDRAHVLGGVFARVLIRQPGG
jgi:hypothetical protein